MDISGFLEEWNNSSDCVLVHTSGSTGKPKPMMVQKEKMLASARMTCNFLGLKKGDEALLCMPLDYIAGKMMVVRSIERGLELLSVEPCSNPLAKLISQYCSVSDFAKSSIQEIIDSKSCKEHHLCGNGCNKQNIENLALIAMVPYQVHCSLQVPQEKEILMNCRNLIIGGGAISDELQKELEDFPNAVWSTYGMTETLSHIALRRLNGPERSEWYTPFESVKVGVNDESCLWIDAPMVHEGVLQTNDIAEVLEGSTCLTQDAGCQEPFKKIQSAGGPSNITGFKIIGRKDNVICCAGVKLHIEQIEEALKPYIKEEFCVSKRKDVKFGEIAVLLVADKFSNDSSTGLKNIIEANSQNGIEEEDFEEAFNKKLQTDGETLTSAIENLERYQRPKAIIHVNEIPLTATGKINRNAAEILANQEDK